MAELKIAATKREITSKSAVNKLRKDGFVPGVFYSNEYGSVAFFAPEGQIIPLIYTTENHLVSLELEGEEPKRAVVKDVQFDPITDKITHIDFHGLKAGQKIEIEVPLQLVGTAPGIKEGGVLDNPLHKLSVECLPKHIPAHLDIDISEMQIGDTIHVSDLSFENLEIITPLEATVVTVTVPQIEEEEDTEAVDDVLGEAGADPDVKDEEE